MLKLIFKYIQRKRHAKGYGIHSPFAFQLVTKVIYEKYPYYAFFDIPKYLNHLSFKSPETKFNQLTYRLIQHFKPMNALDLGSANAVNTHFIASALHDKSCFAILPDMTKSDLARNLLHSKYDNVTFIDQPDNECSYDSVFIDPEIYRIEPEKLFTLSSERSFWVVQNINRKKSKLFWKKTVTHERADVIFEMKKIGVVIIDENLKKNHYII